MSLKREIKMIVIPGLAGPSKALNSLCKLDIILPQNKEDRLGLAQYRYGIRISPSRVDNQFNDKEALVVGSNLEKRFAIIFSERKRLVVLYKKTLFWLGF